MQSIKSAMQERSSIEKDRELSTVATVFSSAMFIGTAAMLSVSSISNQLIEYANYGSIALLTASSTLSAANLIHKNIHENKIVKNHGTLDQISKWKKATSEKMESNKKSWMKASLLAGSSATFIYSTPLITGVLANKFLLGDLAAVTGGVVGALSLAMSPSTLKQKKIKSNIMKEIIATQQVASDKKSNSQANDTLIPSPLISASSIARFNHDNSVLHTSHKKNKLSK